MNKLWIPAALALVLFGAAGCMHDDGMMKGGMSDDGMKDTMSDEGKMKGGMSDEGMMEDKPMMKDESMGGM